MRYPVIAVLFLAAALPAGAQHAMGGFRSFGTAGTVARPMGTVTRPGDPVHGIGFRFASGIGTLHFPNGVHRPLGTTFFGFNRFPGRCFNGFCGFGFNGSRFGNFGFGSGFGGFGYGYPYAYAIDPYSSSYSMAQGQGDDQQLESYLADQQQRNAELELELRNARQQAADREAGQAPPAAAPPPREPDGPGTVLIFKDGSRTEVQNYAILGDTLYEVGGNFTKRVPLSTLDVPATIKVNNDRGVEFSMPGKTDKGG